MINTSLHHSQTTPGNIQPGQWILFQPIDEAESKNDLYRKDRVFKVIEREDLITPLAEDRCRCSLMDINGKKYDYVFRMAEIDGNECSYSFNLRDKVLIISDEEMEKLYGKESVAKVNALVNKVIKTVKNDPQLKLLLGWALLASAASR